MRYVLTLFFIGIFLSGCGARDTRLVGIWKAADGSNEWSFSADGKYANYMVSLSSDPITQGTYDFDGEVMKCTDSKNELLCGSYSVSIEPSGNSMTLSALPPNEPNPIVYGKQ